MGERVYADEAVVIEVFRDLGPLSNNAYLVRPAGGGPGLLVDAPEGVEAVVGDLRAEDLLGVVLTHSHRDHWAGHEAVRALGVPFHAGASEVNLDTVEAEGALSRLRADDALAVGGVRVRVLETPGHTPGSICLLVNGAVLTGDTLFPGGPGYSRDHAAFEREVASITSQLYPLPSDTLVLPGHGAGTTIGASREEYEAYAAREHASDLHGDVLWASS